MVSCPFIPKEHCRLSCIFRVTQGKKVTCLLREALLQYLGYKKDIETGTIYVNVITKETG